MALTEILDPTFLKELVDSVKGYTGTPGASPPTKVAMMGGFDGTYTRRVRVDADGFVQIKSV